MRLTRSLGRSSWSRVETVSRGDDSDSLGAVSVGADGAATLGWLSDPPGTAKGWTSTVATGSLTGLTTPDRRRSVSVPRRGKPCPSG